MILRIIFKLFSCATFSRSRAFFRARRQLPHVPQNVRAAGRLHSRLLYSWGVRSMRVSLSSKIRIGISSIQYSSPEAFSCQRPLFPCDGYTIAYLFLYVKHFDNDFQIRFKLYVPCSPNHRVRSRSSLRSCCIHSRSFLLFYPSPVSAPPIPHRQRWWPTAKYQWDSQRTLLSCFWGYYTPLVGNCQCFW